METIVSHRTEEIGLGYLCPSLALLQPYGLGLAWVGPDFLMSLSCTVVLYTAYCRTLEINSNLAHLMPEDFSQTQKKNA